MSISGNTPSILEAYVTLRREIALIRSAELKSVDFGHNQISVLYRLLVSSASMGELAEYASSDKASMTRTVALLEKQGLVRRIPDKNDRRVVTIELTAKGKIKATVAQEIRMAVEKKLDNCLTTVERKQFAALVQKLSENIRTYS